MLYVGIWILWIIIVALTVVPCVILVQQALNRFFHNPTVISLERDHWNFVTIFPAVTLCQREFLPILLDPVKEKLNASDNFAEFLQILMLGNFSIYKELLKYKSEYDRIDPNLYLEINNNLTGINEYSTITFMNHVDTLEKVITEFGFCFQFNSKISNYISYEYWIQNRSNVNTPILREIVSDEEQPLLNLDAFSGTYYVFLHCPEDTIDVQSSKGYVKENSIADFLVTTTTSWTPENVKGLTVNQRHCRFLDESNLKYSPVYSYKLCKIDCRMKMALKLCKCLPFYYRNRYGEKICGIDGMVCLSNYAEQLVELENKNGTSLCNCMPTCKDDIITTIDASFLDWITDSRITCTYEFRTKVRYMRSIIFSLADLIVQIGGLAGFCYGLSMLSAVELIYFITLRFFCGVILNRSI